MQTLGERAYLPPSAGPAKARVGDYNLHDSCPASIFSVNQGPGELREPVSTQGLPCNHPMCDPLHACIGRE
jgi:hypothetical protein